MARGGDLDAVLKAMFGTHGEAHRTNAASTLGKPAYDSVGLGSQFATAIDDMRFVLKLRNYAHSRWHDANTDYLSFVNLEELATTPTTVTDLMDLTIKYLGMPILTDQEEYLDFVDRSIQYLNYEGRFRRGDLSSNSVPAPTARARPLLCR